MPPKTGLTVQLTKNGTGKSDQPFFVIFLISNDVINSIIHHFFLHVHNFRLQKIQVHWKSNFGCDNYGSHFSQALAKEFNC